MAQLRQVTMAFKIRTYDEAGYGLDVFTAADFPSACERVRVQTFGTNNFALVTDNGTGIVHRESDVAGGGYEVSLEFDPCQTT